jgi:hypothetical protein
MSSSILENKCDPCRGIIRTHVADIADIMGLVEDYGVDYGEDYPEDDEHEYGHSCPTCDFFGLY